MAEHRFSFESYGVRVSIDSNSAAILDTASRVARSALLGNVDEIEYSSAVERFRLFVDDQGICTVFQNDESMVSGEPEFKFWKFFDSLVRILVAEFSSTLIFVHAG